MAINVSYHLVASDESFIMPPSRTQHGIYLYDSAILCNDIHFILPYNTNEKIKNKTARCRAGLALFIAI